MSFLLQALTIVSSETLISSISSGRVALGVLVLLELLDEVHEGMVVVVVVVVVVELLVVAAGTVRSAARNSANMLSKS
jgi:hypothetical protein